jgi:alanyl-tRNA synthetase
MTTRLYYTAPWQREFDATVVAVEERDGVQHVRLDRTAFYPTSGGQPHDTGTLGGARVIEVIDEADLDGPAADATPPQIVHVLDGRLEAGARVTGQIDWPRRFDHMQQHTGQHVLSAAFHHLHGVRTVSFHLGAEVSTIDLARDLTPQEISGAATEANRIVWEDRPVTIRFASSEEVGRLPLRKEPVKSGRLRLIDVGGYDLSACGGTHVSRTGAIGLVAVRAWERFKGGTRLTFVCGGRALRAFEELRDVVDAAARPLTVHPRDLPGAVERLLDERKARQREVRTIGERLAGYEGARLAAEAAMVGDLRVVLAAASDQDADGLKALAAAAVRSGAHGAVLLTASRPLNIVVASAADGAAGFDAGAIVKALAARFGGRGGGRPDLAQGGGLDAAPDEVLAAARALVAGAS